MNEEFFCISVILFFNMFSIMNDHYQFMKQIAALLPNGPVENDKIKVSKKNFEFKDPDFPNGLLSYRFDFLYTQASELLNTLKIGKDYSILTFYTTDCPVYPHKLKIFCHSLLEAYSCNRNAGNPPFILGTFKKGEVFDYLGIKVPSQVLTPDNTPFDTLFSSVKRDSTTGVIFKIGISPCYTWMVCSAAVIAENAELLRAKTSSTIIDLHFEPTGNPSQNKLLFNSLKTLVSEPKQSSPKSTSPKTPKRKKSPSKTNKRSQKHLSPPKNRVVDISKFSWASFITKNAAKRQYDDQRLVHIANKATTNPDILGDELGALNSLLAQEVFRQRQFRDSLPSTLNVQQEELNKLKEICAKNDEEIQLKQQQYLSKHIKNKNHSKEDQERTIGQADDYDFTISCLEKIIKKVEHEVDYLKSICVLQEVLEEDNQPDQTQISAEEFPDAEIKNEEEDSPQHYKNEEEDEFSPNNQEEEELPENYNENKEEEELPQDVENHSNDNEL